MSSVVFWAVLALAATDTTKVNQLGPVSVTTTLAPAEPTIGDEITLEIRVEAEPEVEVLMPEFGEAVSRYTILNFVPRQRIDDRGKTVLVQRYTLQPYLSGPQCIPPILVEFIDHRPGQKASPDDFDAYEILTDRIDFLVKSVVPRTATQDLRPPLGELDLTTERSRTAIVGTILGSAAAIGAAVAGWLLWRRRRHRTRRRNAYDVARARLNKLLSRPWPQEASAIDMFFVTISSIVRRYLEDRFDLRAPELTTEEFLALAGSASDLSRDHQHLLRDFLRQADLVKFADIRASEDEIRRSSELAARFLDDTRDNAPLIDDPDLASDPSAGAATGNDRADSSSNAPHVEDAHV